MAHPRLRSESAGPSSTNRFLIPTVNDGAGIAVLAQPTLQQVKQAAQAPILAQRNGGRDTPTGPSKTGVSSSPGITSNRAEAIAGTAAKVAKSAELGFNTGWQSFKTIQTITSPLGLIANRVIKSGAEAVARSNPPALEGAAVVSNQGPPGYTNDDDLTDAEAQAGARTKQAYGAALSAKTGKQVSAAAIQKEIIANKTLRAQKQKIAHAQLVEKHTKQQAIRDKTLSEIQGRQGDGTASGGDFGKGMDKSSGFGGAASGGVRV